MMAFPIQHLVKRGNGQFEVGEATRRWLDSINARPAYKRALARMEEEERTQQAKL